MGVGDGTVRRLCATEMTMDTLERLLLRISRGLTYLATISLLLMTVLVITSSIMRYFVGRPFRFTEELVALLYMAMVYLAIPLVTARRAQITVSVLPERLTERLAGLLRVGSALVMVGFCTWFMIEAWDFSEYSRRLSSKTEQFDILLWPWMALIPVTLGFTTLIEIFYLFHKPSPSAVESGQALPIGDGL